jgi:aminoglycoside 6'-N-acetyltransferase I
MNLSVSVNSKYKENHFYQSTGKISEEDMTMIKRAVLSDSREATELALLLWPDHDFDELEKEISHIIFSFENAVFLYMEEASPVGYAQCSLRKDYVEGTQSNPVGYLEGIFVKDAYRQRGIAKQLLEKCELWAKEKGCSEFASDCELDNTDSLRFHLNSGFEEANRIICFTKKI